LAMAYQAWRHLAGVTPKLLNGIPVLKESISVREIDATLAREFASVRLGVIVVRTTSAIMPQITLNTQTSGQTLIAS
jgi:hypothetical protein